MDIKLIENENTPVAPPIRRPQFYYGENKELIESVTKYVVDNHNALGIAANQLSLNGKRLNKRFFMERVLWEETNESGQIWRPIVNPHIVERYGVIDRRIEGCLTWVGKDLVADRYRKIAVAYYNMHGEFVEEFITGFQAHVWQHEINHLDGVPEVIADSGMTNHNLAVKYERNEPCPCGTGKKYKKCCGMYEVKIREFSKNS